MSYDRSREVLGYSPAAVIAGVAISEMLSQLAPPCHRCLAELDSRSDPVVHVVAGVIERNGRFFLQQRAPEGTFPFARCSPGGKVEPGESDEEALKRELAQECAVDSVIGESLFEYVGGNLVVRFYRVEYITPPYPRDYVGIGGGWYTREERAALQLTPADTAFRAYSDAELAKVLAPA